MGMYAFCVVIYNCINNKNVKSFLIKVEHLVK